MSLKNLQVIFKMDGTGVYSDKYEPTHLDALLMWVKCERAGLEPPGRNDPPDDIDMPFAKWEIGGHWGWRASVVISVNIVGEVIGYLRKRIRMDRIPYTDGGGIVTVGGEYMSKNIPIPKKICAYMTGYCVGDIDVVRDLASCIRYLGRYTSGGVGRVAAVEVVEIAGDWSCVKDSAAMRHLPKADGFRLCRVRPPYWNNVDRVNVCEIGDSYPV